MAPSLDGPLQHLVEQLWQPALATGRARVRLDREAGEPSTSTWHTAEEYLVVPGATRASLLLPAGPARATSGALLNYRGLRRLLPNAQRAVLGLLARSGAPLPFPRLRVETRAGAEQASEDALLLPLGFLQDVLGRPDLRAAIGVRTGANRKATLQLVDLEGQPVGFAKFAWNRSSTQGIEREASALSTPLDEGPARTPALLARGEYLGRAFLVTAPLPETARGVRSGVRPPTAQELYALTPLGRGARPAETGQLQSLRARLETLDPTPETAKLLGSAHRLLARVEQYADAVPVTTRWHGDLTPWNCARDAEGVLWTWDWESSEPDAVAGLDAVHWHLSVGAEAGGRFDGSGLRSAVERARPLVVAAGATHAGVDRVAAVYALTLTERACALASETGEWEEGWVLPEDLHDLLSQAGRGLETSR